MYDSSSGAIKVKEKQSFTLLFICLKSEKDTVVVVLGVHKYMPSSYRTR